jgi:hypothetical protein
MLGHGEFMPVIPALRRLRQEGFKFETSLGYIVIHCLKKKKEQKEGCYDSPFQLSLREMPVVYLLVRAAPAFLTSLEFI